MLVVGVDSSDNRKLIFVIIGRPNGLCDGCELDHVTCVLEVIFLMKAHLISSRCYDDFKRTFIVQKAFDNPKGIIRWAPGNSLCSLIFIFHHVDI